MELESSRHLKNSNLAACLCSVHPKRLLFSCRWNGWTADLIPRSIPPSPFAWNLSGDGHLQTVRKAVCNRCLFFFGTKKKPGICGKKLLRAIHSRWFLSTWYVAKRAPWNIDMSPNMHVNSKLHVTEYPTQLCCYMLSLWVTGPSPPTEAPK